MTAASDPLAGRIAAHLRYLAEEIGPRPGGSPGNRAAADYVCRVMEASGLAVERQEFACPSWEEVETTLAVDGEPLGVVANLYSPACDLSAPAVAVGTVEALEAADLAGKVAVLYGELTEDTLSPKGWFLKSERDDRIIQTLERKSPAALVTVQPRLGELERLIEDPDFHIPSATVSAREGLGLLSRLASTRATVRLQIDSRRSPGQTWNVIGRKPGEGNGRVVLCAHYDTKHDTPGALDNAGGVATMLALAEHLLSRGVRVGLECIAFGNEDSLPEGGEFYLRDHESTLGDVVAVLNFDGVGHALDVNTVAIMAHSGPFRALVEGVKGRYADLVWVDPWPESNHSTFAWRGVPCLAFTSRAAYHLAHLRADSVEWVSPASLATLVRFAAEVVEGLQQYPPTWSREKG